MKTRKRITWKQAVNWGWGPHSGLLSYTNRATGRIGRAGNRLCRLPYWLMRMFEMRGRLADVVNPRLTRVVGDVVYEIGMPPIPSCRRCGRETWDRTISGICRARKLCVRGDTK